MTKKAPYLKNWLEAVGNVLIGLYRSGSPALVLAVLAALLSAMAAAPPSALCQQEAKAARGGNVQLLTTGQDQDQSQAKAVVERLHKGLIEIMKAANRGASCRERLSMIEPVVKEVFDFPLISKIVLGRAWKGLSREEKRRFIEAFSAMSAATYAKRFKAWKGERFETIETLPARRGRIKVKTLLIKPDGDEVELDYLLHRTSRGPKIVSVIAMGVSDLSLKRVEYAFYLKTHSIDQLISRLEEQADECI